MGPEFLPMATLAYTTFNSPNIGNYTPYELVFGRKPKILLILRLTQTLEYQDHIKTTTFF